MCAYVPVGITAFRQADSWYIGLYDHFRAFAHQWLDGSLLTFSQFVKGEPNSVGYNCVTFLRSGPDGLQEWYDSICSGLRSFVCERPVGQCFFFFFLSFFLFLLLFPANLFGSVFRQCPLLAPSVRGPQMV